MRPAVALLEPPLVYRPDGHRAAPPPDVPRPVDLLDRRHDRPRPRLPAKHRSRRARAPHAIDFTPGFHCGHRAKSVRTSQTASGGAAISISRSLLTGASSTATG